MRLGLVFLLIGALQRPLQAAWIPSLAPSAASPTSQALWSSSYTHPDPADRKAVKAYAVAALAQARKDAAAAPLSPGAQVALAECAIRASYVGGIEVGISAGTTALKAIMKARELKADADDLARVQARRQLYLAKAFGGDLKAAAAYFEAEHAKDAAGGWNAYFCGEALRQMKKKKPAKEWFEKALAVNPQHPLALAGLKKL